MTRGTRKEMKWLDTIKKNEDKYYNVPSLFSIASDFYNRWVNSNYLVIPYDSPGANAVLTVSSGSPIWITNAVGTANNLQPRRGYDGMININMDEEPEGEEHD